MPPSVSVFGFPSRAHIILHYPRLTARSPESLKGPVSPLHHVTRLRPDGRVWASASGGLSSLSVCKCTCWTL